MAEASSDEKDKLLAHHHQHSHYNGHGNGNGYSNGHAINWETASGKSEEVVHAQASWFASSIYMVLLVICGASMTIIISYQDALDIYSYDPVYRNLTCKPAYLVDLPVELPIEEQAPPLYVPSSFDMSALAGGEDGYCPKFHQPFIQLFQMGVGQVLTGLSFPFFRQRTGDASVPLQDPGFWDFAPKAGLASLFDALAEVFIILGISATYPSTAELMKATLVVFVGMASTRFFPGFTLSRRQWFAVIVMLGGAGVAMCQPYIDPQEEQEAQGPLRFVIGAMLCLGAQMFYAMQFIVEEKLMDDCKVKQMHVNKGLLVFCEGWVSILCAVILQIPFTIITDADGFSGFLSDLHYYFATTALWASGIGLSAAVAGFDIFGLLTAEHLGSDLRAVVTASFQVLLVWIISAFWLSLEVYSWVFILGFVLIISAGFFYVFSSKRKNGPRHSHERELVDGIA